MRFGSFVINMSRDSEATLQSIGQYIDDYIDLVENVPNDIVRGITQFHEKNHLYHQLLDRLERSLEQAIACGDDDAGRKKALGWVQRFLIDIQSLSDEKLAVGQSMYEQLELKSRQLELDIRSIQAGQGGANIISPVKKSTAAASSDPSTSSNNKSISTSSQHAPGSSRNSEESRDSFGSPDHNEKDDHVVNSGRGKKRSKDQANSGNHNHNHSNNMNNGKDSDNDDEDLSVGMSSGSSKRTRRGGKGFSSNRGQHPSHHSQSSHHHDDSLTHHSSGGKGSGKHSGGRGGKTRRGNSGSGTGTSSNSGRHHRDVSPPSIYDEPSALDPDEPTYCVCQQISFGEMIGCDNPRCPIEWFHFACVHLTNKPKGKWYCPQCRGDRSNIQKK